VSIYASWLLLAGGDTDADGPAPLIYRGSHISPADDGGRDGWVEVAAIPNHCHPAIRGKPSGELTHEVILAHPVEFLRLSLGEGEATDAPQVTVVLDRSQVEHLQVTLTTWLDTSGR
jgi:hypothetical protein